MFATLTRTAMSLFTIFSKFSFFLRPTESSLVNSVPPIKSPQAADQLANWAAPLLSYEELLPKTQNPSPESYLIDVREPNEVAQGMIPSAVNIPLSILADSLALDADAFKAKFGFEKPRPNQEVIFYCRSGKRSTAATDVAKRNGFTNIQNFLGSWSEWTEKQNLKPTQDK